MHSRSKPKTKVSATEADSKLNAHPQTSRLTQGISPFAGSLISEISSRRGSREFLPSLSSGHGRSTEPAGVSKVGSTAKSDVITEEPDSYDDSRPSDTKTSSMTSFTQMKQGGRRQSMVVAGSTYPDVKTRRDSTVSTLASSERSSTASISMAMREPVTTKHTTTTGVDTTSPSSSSVLSLPTPPSHHRLHHPEPVTSTAAPTPNAPHPLVHTHEPTEKVKTGYITPIEEDRAFVPSQFINGETKEVEPLTENGAASTQEETLEKGPESQTQDENGEKDTNGEEVQMEENPTTLDFLYDKEENKPTLFPLDTNLDDLTDITKAAHPDYSPSAERPSLKFSTSSGVLRGVQPMATADTSDEDEYKTAAMKKARSLVNLPSWSSSESLRKLGNQTDVNSTGWVAPQSWDVDTSTNQQSKLKAKMRAKAKARAKARARAKAKAKAKARARAESQERLRRVDTTPIDPLTTILSGGVLVVPDSDENEAISPNEPIHFNQNSFGETPGVENPAVADIDDSSSSGSELDTTASSSSEWISTTSDEYEDFYDVQNSSRQEHTPNAANLPDRAFSTVGVLSPPPGTGKGSPWPSDDERYDKVEYRLEKYYKDFSDLDPKRHYAIRIFNTDDTFTTLSCVPNTTVEELIPTLKKKFNITSQSSFQISLKVGKLSKILRPLSKPILIERKLLLLNGYRKSDPLHIIGVEDLSFVFKFLFHPVTPSHFTPEQEQRLLRSDFVHVDLRNMELTTPPIIFYQHTSEIESLDVSNNADIFLPLEFIESSIKLLSLRMVNVRASKFPVNITEAYKLVSLELQRNFIKKIPGSISMLSNLTILNMQCNELDKLPAGFAQLKNLQLLDLSSNRFITYPEVINECTNLLQIDLSYNKIYQLPSSINQLQKLAKVNLSHNKLTTIGDLSRLKNLRTLNLRHNRIGSIMTNAPNLQNLFLSDNRISNFEDILPKLRALEIQENPITYISLKTFYPINMTSLSLNKAQLASIPGEIFTKLSRLEKLELSENNLTRLPSEICQLSKLIYLSAARNKLESLPSEFFKLKSLRSLDLHSNNIRDFFAGMEDIELTFLNISSNMFGASDLSGSFYRNLLNGTKLSKSLLFFVAADNQFGDGMWSFFNCFVNLKLLNLSYNNLSDASQLKLENLTDLYLSGNSIATLHGDTVLKWKQLRTLMLNGNHLSSLPGELSQLTQLNVFDIGSNQLKYNIANFHYDWNWRNNRELKYLNFSGNKRFEIRTAYNEETKSDMSDLTILPHLRELGLMDVTLNTRRVPDENSNFRLRTTPSIINGMRYGVADTLGQKNYVSSRDVTFERFRGKEDECLVCLHDSKNLTADYGHNISRIVRDIYDKILIRQLEKFGDDSEEKIKRALRFSFLQVNKEINGMLSSVDSGTDVENLTSADLLSGACSTVVYIKGNKLYSANIGDCTAVISKSNGDFQKITKLHIPSEKEEYERIRISGGLVNNGKLDGVVDVSRAVGFFDLLPHIHASPDISVSTLTKADEMLVIATRQLWEFMDTQTACDIARENSSHPMLAAEKMKDYAIAYGCSENITILCLSLHNSTEQPNRFALNRNALLTRRSTFEDATLRRLQPEIAPPTGNVAIVFTDIKNSTFLWELFPNAMRTAIKTHNDIMRRQLRIFGGYEVKTEGDAFMVAFPTPIGALVWCLSVQLKLLDAQWPEEITSIQGGSLVTDANGVKIYYGLSVRMGIHWGYPVPELDLVTQRMDYLGPVVNKAARISSVADGGEITLSSDFVSEFNKIMKYHDEVVTAKQPLKEVYGEEIVGEVLEKEIAMLENIGWSFFDYGEKKLKGLETKEFITIAYPKLLESRHEFVTEEEDDKIIDSSILFRLRKAVNKLETISSALNGSYLEIEGHLESDSSFGGKSEDAVYRAINEMDIMKLLDHLVTRTEALVAVLQLRQRLLCGLSAYNYPNKIAAQPGVFELLDKVFKQLGENQQ